MTRRSPALRRLAGVSLVALSGAALGLFPDGAQAQQAPSDSVRIVSLQEAIRLATERNPLAVQAASQTSSARADLLQARGALLPSVTLNGIYSNSSNQRFDQATGQLTSQSYTSQLQTSYEVFGGGRRLAQLRGAGADVDAALAQERAQGFQVALATTTLFFQAAAASDILAAARQRLDRANQQLSFARTRLELGTATTSDELRAQIEVGNAQLAVVDAEAALRTSTLALGRQIGEEGEVVPAPSSLPATPPTLPPTETLVQQALHGAPSVVAAEATLKSRSANKLAALTPYVPSVRVTGGYDWFSYQFPPHQQSWSLRLTASLPVFNGFQREAALSRAQAQQRVAEAQNRDAQLGARVQVESAVADIAAAGRRVEISANSLSLAQEDLRVQEERYQIGASTILDLQTSQVALADAEVAAVRARQDLGTATARLEAILGEPIGEE